MANNRFSVEAIFKAVDKITAPVKRMQSNIAKFTRRAGKGLRQLNNMSDKFLGGMKRVGRVAGVAFAATGAAMAVVIKKGAEFELNIIRAASKFPSKIKKGTDAFKELSLEVRKLAATTEFTATQSSEALNTLATAGFDAKTAISLLPKVMELATVAQIELAESARIAIKTMGVFGLDSKKQEVALKNITTVTDVLAKASTSATTTIEDLFEAISNGAGTAQTVGISMNDTISLLNLMADSGIDASKAGNALKRFSLSLTSKKEGEEGAKALRFLNIETTEFIKGIKQTRNVFSIIKDLQKNIALIDPGDRPRLINAIFGKLTIDGAVKLISKATSAVEDMRKKVADNSGELNRMSVEIRKATAIRLKVLISRIEELGLKIFDLIEGPFNKVITRMVEWFELYDSDVAEGFKKFIDGMIKNKEKILKFGKAVLILGSVFAALIITMKTFIVVMNAANLAMAMNPVGATILLITLLILSITAAVLAVVFFREEILGWWDDLGAGWKIIAAIVGGPLFWLVIIASKIIKAWEPIKTFFKDIGKAIGSAFKQLVKFADKFKIFDLTGTLAALSFGAGALDSGDEDQEEEAPQPQTQRSQVVSQEGGLADLARTIQKSMTEITIRDESGRAEVTGGKLGNGISLDQSGAFAR